MKMSAAWQGVHTTIIEWWATGSLVQSCSLARSDSAGVANSYYCQDGGPTFPPIWDTDKVSLGPTLTLIGLCILEDFLYSFLYELFP